MLEVWQSVGRENTLARFTGTDSGSLRSTGGHTGRRGPPVPGVAGHGQETPATAAAHWSDWAAPSLLWAQATDLGCPPDATAKIIGQKA